MTPEVIAGRASMLLLCDHASNAVPPRIALGVAPAVMTKHVAVDIGAADLTRALAAALDATAILANVSRLVIDLHREPDHPGLIPTESDRHAVPGNVGVDRAERIARFHAPYHRAVGDAVRRVRPALIVAIHSFTPRLEAGDAPARAWQAGVLYNRDRRAAGLSLDFLRGKGIVTGDNEPYSGRHLNATLNRHGEANGIPSVSVEVRNDLLGATDDIIRWSDTIARMTRHVRNGLAQKWPVAT